MTTPGHASGGTVYGHATAGRRAAPSRPPRPRPLRTAGFELDVDALDILELPTGPAGLVLGVDAHRRPAVVRLFREQSTRVTLVGGMYAVRLLVLRALGFGARVIVQTERPAAWSGWPSWVTGRQDRLVLASPGAVVSAGGTADSPALVISDTGLSPHAAPPNLGPWQTQLTVLPQLTAHGFAALGQSDVLVFQRLRPEEAIAAGGALRLTPDVAAELQSMPDDVIALRGGGTDRYVWLEPTPVERDALGAPQRDG
jgi:hypothetical protein